MVDMRYDRLFHFNCMTEEDRNMNTLLFQKGTGGEIKDLLSAFNIGVKGIPLFVPTDMKDLPSRDWPGEDGEDVFFPSNNKYKAYDIEIDVHYKGSRGSFPSVMSSLFAYLTKNGTELSIYSPYTQTGCKGAYFKGFGNFDFHRDDEGEDAGFKMKFRVTKPNETFIAN